MRTLKCALNIRQIGSPTASIFPDFSRADRFPLATE